MRKFTVLLLSAFGGIANLSHADSESSNHLVKVREIAFVGNHRFTSEQLKSQLATKESQSIDLSSSEKPFDRDVQKLNYTYFKQGFVQAKIDQPEIVFAPDKKSARLVFNLKEGEQFRVGRVGFWGKWPVSQSDLRAITQLQKQPFFDYQVLQDDLKALEAKCGDKFYPIPRTRIREVEREVDVTFELARKST